MNKKVPEADKLVSISKSDESSGILKLDAEDYEDYEDDKEDESQLKDKFAQKKLQMTNKKSSI